MTKPNTPDDQVSEKLEIIRLLDSDIADKKAECDRLSTIVVQRRMDQTLINEQYATHIAVVSMFRSRYGHEIRTGQHDGKSVHHLVAKYLARERNLAQGTMWRVRLARFILGDLLDRPMLPIRNKPASPSQFKETNDE